MLSRAEVLSWARSGKTRPRPMGNSSWRLPLGLAEAFLAVRCSPRLSLLSPPFSPHFIPVRVSPSCGPKALPAFFISFLQ